MATAYDKPPFYFGSNLASLLWNETAWALNEAEPAFRASNFFRGQVVRFGAVGANS